MSAKDKILEIEAGLVRLDSDLIFALALVNSANAGLAAAFEVGDGSSIENARGSVGARTYDVECLAQAKRDARAKLPALRLLYLEELN